MAADTRDQMIRTAAALFQREGYGATSWRRLVDRAGTPWGSIHHHFPGGKEELGVAAIDLSSNAVAELIDDCFTKQPDAASAVDRWFHVTTELVAGSGYTGGCPIALVALECADDPGAVHDATRRAFERWETTLATHLHHSGRSKPASRDLAATLLILLEGALLLARVQASDRPMGLARRQARLLMNAP